MPLGQPSLRASPPDALPDVLIAGAGVIGLSLALELRRRGATVTVLERGTALGGASSAAAGMLAAEDPHNPPGLLPFSRYSLALYPGFLDRLEALSGQRVPFQTSETVQYTDSGAYRLAENSLDPRQLASALLTAARAASVAIVENDAIAYVSETPDGVEVRTVTGASFRAAQLVHATGAWRLPEVNLPLFPRKGQMLRVVIPSDSPLSVVHRSERVYVVPRTSGPQAGTALVGATVEDAGFDLSTDLADLQRLRGWAAQLSPEIAFIADAPLVEAWAGIRPCTPDFLPLLGRLSEREWIAAGHFRNGILLAPGTATLMAYLLSGTQPALDLQLFSPTRFTAAR